MQAGIEVTRLTPQAFLSYFWESDAHRQWVLELGTRLRADGVEVTLDQWHVQPGDQLPAFMEHAVRDNDYVLIVCTPHDAERSNQRRGGVGYEGDIMTAEVFTTRNKRKFIPIFRSGAWEDAAPSWLRGKYCVDLRGDPYPDEHYQDLLYHPPRASPGGTARCRTPESDSTVVGAADGPFCTGRGKRI